MFEVNENMDEGLCEHRVALIGKTADIWKQQAFAEEFKLLEGDPLDYSSWRSVDIGFILICVISKQFVRIKRIYC